MGYDEIKQTAYIVPARSLRPAAEFAGPGPMMNLTEERQAIVACDLKPGEILKIMAFASTGKTTTLVAHA